MRLLVIAFFLFPSVLMASTGPQKEIDGYIYTLGSPSYNAQSYNYYQAVLGFPVHCFSNGYSRWELSYFDGATQYWERVNQYDPGKWDYRMYPILGRTLADVDKDDDGLSDDYDPCPDTPDNYIKHYLAPNSCDGSYYFFQITGECGETKTYYNPKYSSVNEAYQDATANPNCSAEPEEKSVTPQQVQNFFASNAGGSTAPAGSGVIPEQSVDLTGGNSTSTSPQEVTSDDPDTQKVIDAIKVMRETLEETLDKQTKKLVDSENLAADRIVSTLKSGNNLVSGRLSGVENAINVLKGNAGTYADQAHTDSENISKSIKDLAKAVNGSGDVVEVSVNGTEFEPPTTELEGVGSDRVSAAKVKFNNSWSNLQNSFKSIFTVSISGTSDLPKWTWDILGNNVVIDFNDYSTELNWIGLAGVLFASIAAIFIVIDK